MSCCANDMTQKEHDEQYKGQCSDCGCDVDVEGICCEMGDCSYSPKACDKCGYRPCDGSC